MTQCSSSSENAVQTEQIVEVNWRVPGNPLFEAEWRSWKLQWAKGIFVTSTDPEALELFNNLRLVGKPSHYLTIHRDLKNRVAADVTGVFKSIN